MAGITFDNLRGLSEDELQDCLEKYHLCKAGLSSIQFKYWIVKEWYYSVNPNIIALIVAGILIVSGLMSWEFKINPWASFALTGLGIVVGIIAIWELERRR